MGGQGNVFTSKVSDIKKGSTSAQINFSQMPVYSSELATTVPIYFNLPRTSLPANVVPRLLNNLRLLPNFSLEFGPAAELSGTIKQAQNSPVTPSPSPNRN